jgi:hypothetical protein
METIYQLSSYFKFKYKIVILETVGKFILYCEVGGKSNGKIKGIFYGFKNKARY